jgi:hypothetical protein
LSILVACLLVVPSGAQGQTAPAGIGVGASLDVESIDSVETGGDLPRAPGGRVWVAKFLCGEIPAVGSPETGSPLAPGSYRTAVNVFNGQLRNPANLGLALALAESPGQPQLRDMADEVIIDPLRAVELDCDFIRRSFANAPSSFIKGFLRIRISRLADGDSRLVKVVAVYTLKNVEGTPTPNQ